MCAAQPADKTAAEPYRQAAEKQKSYESAANLAQAALALGEHREAATFLAYAVANVPETDTKPRERLGRVLAVAEREVARLDITVEPESSLPSPIVDGREIQQLEWKYGI